MFLDAPIAPNKAVKNHSPNIAQMTQANPVSAKIKFTKYHDEAYAKANQQPVYSPNQDVHGTIGKLQKKPALTSKKEIDDLRNQLAQAIRGEKLVVQAGLCAEDMDGLNKQGPAAIRKYAASLVNMSRLLAKTMKKETGKPVVKMVRGAGQLGKPRSNLTDADGTPVFRGHMVNGHRKYDRVARVKRMETSYDFAGDVGYNIIRHGGKDIFTMSEMLHVPYMEGLTRGKLLGTNPFGWVGARTNDLNSDQINKAVEVDNPVGIKVGPDVTPQLLEDLINKVNKNAVPGKLTLIFRMGADQVDTALSPLLDVVKQFRDSVVLVTDPMHGNTKTDQETELKTRYVDDIVCETVSFVKQCKEMGLNPGGIHLEVNALDDVTECIGVNVQKIQKENYKTLVDPCLNLKQAEYVVQRFGQAYMGN